MATYSLVSNAKFNPFSYDELVKPLVQYKEAYEKAEADYSNLAMQTEAWRDIASQENSPEAYRMFKTYSDELNKMTDDFSKGMTLNNRSALMGLKRRYASEITPIARASEALEKASALRMDIRSKNPNAVFEVDDYNSIDSLLKGKRANNNYWDGEAAMKRVAAKAESLGRAIYSDPNATVFLNGQQFKISQMNGFSPEELTQILLHPENINSEVGRQMRQILDDELKGVDLNSYSTQGKSKINNILSTGMYAGLAKPTYQYVGNGEYVSKGQRQSHALQQAQYNLSKSQWEYQKGKDEIASGQKPYATDANGTKYYRSGTAFWTVGKDGKMSEPSKLETPGAKGKNGFTVLESGRSGTKKTENFVKSDFKMWNIGSDNFTEAGGFDASDSEPKSPYDLSADARGKLAAYLNQHDLTLDDVDIHYDADNFMAGRDHFRVVKKGFDVYGNKVNKSKSTSTSTSGSSNNTSKQSNTTTANKNGNAGIQ